MQDTQTLYKLIVLYMLNEVDFPLTRAQIFDFILEREYCTFFPLQKAIAELTDSDLIRSKSLHNSTHLTLTEEGEKTLRYFSGRIDPGIKQDIRTFFDQNKLAYKNEVAIQSDYFKTGQGEYTARLLITEDNGELLRLEMTVPTKNGALEICKKWSDKNQEVYSYLTETLM